MSILVVRIASELKSAQNTISRYLSITILFQTLHGVGNGGGVVRVL